MCSVCDVMACGLLQRFRGRCLGCAGFTPNLAVMVDAIRGVTCL